MEFELWPTTVWPYRGGDIESMERYTVLIETAEEMGGWTFFRVPCNVQEVFGSKDRISVSGTLNGVHFRRSLFPRGDGSHYMLINREMRDRAGVSEGDTAELVLEPEHSTRVLALPAELQERLDKNAEARFQFERLFHSHQREYIEWILEAKKEETRKRRVDKLMSVLLEARKIS